MVPLRIAWIFFFAASATAETLPLWPAGKMPGEALVAGALKPGQEKNAVSEPTLAIFPSPDVDKAAPAVLVCPGGGYQHLAYDKEGVEIARWLNTLGITAVVLKYRVPGNRAGAFQDVQRALRTVRARAVEWRTDPTRVGILGFSAGGHLSARLCTNFEKPAYPAIDAIDTANCRPDFAILVYPAYLEVKGQLAPELPVSSHTPPTFLVHTEDDRAFIQSSKVYQAALEAAGVPNEYLLLQTGGHGYGLRSPEEIRIWPERLKAWLAKEKVL